jgi:hypothetical protein
MKMKIDTVEAHKACTGAHGDDAGDALCAQPGPEKYPTSYTKFG